MYLWIFHICFSLKIVKFGHQIWLMTDFEGIYLSQSSVTKNVQKIFNPIFVIIGASASYMKSFIKFCWPDEKITDGSKFKGIGFDLKGRSRGRRTCRWRQKRLIDIEVVSVQLWLKKCKTTIEFQDYTLREP
jgi:hypothetical protein